jgi:hypothetical protein
MISGACAPGAPFFAKRLADLKHSLPGLARVAASVLLVSAPLATRASDTVPRLMGGPDRPAPVLPPGPSPETAPAGAHLVYYGGRVVSSAQVVQVLWGTGSYVAQVSSTAIPSIASFYEQILHSSIFTSLNEYNTIVSGGTNQTLTTGTFVQQVTITPSIVSSTITDAQIQSEILAQLSAGHLPAPAKDGAGNTVTIYMIYFPHGKTITVGGSSSCQPAGFCGYHGTIAAAGARPEVYYGVFPDFQSGSGCDTACGGAVTTFGNVTSVSSQQLFGTITDPEVGLASVIGAPLAWYDGTYGEIGDICNGQQGNMNGSDGQTYVVQQEFSNAADNCILTAGQTFSDFAISLAQPTVSIVQGSSGSVTVNTAASVAGSPTISLSASGIPAGVSGSFAPSSIPAGSSSSLTLNVGAAVAPGSYPFTVTGSAGLNVHSVGGTLVVLAQGPASLINGGFELGNFTGWTASGDAATLSITGCHGGTYCVQLGSNTPTNGDSSIAQTFVAGGSATQLTFWYKNVCPDVVAFDWATATLTDNTTPSTSTILPKTCTNPGSWTLVTAPLAGGHSYTLTLTSHDDDYAADPTYTLFDDVTTSCGSVADCTDGNACTDDACVSGACTHTNNAAACSDGNACTTGDVCSAGNCQPGLGAPNCNDANPCTDDSCNAISGCVHTNNAAACNDGNSCTSGDTCGGGVCAGSPIPAPPEMQNFVVAADKATYSWPAGSMSSRFDVVRGSIGSFPVGPGGADETCFDNLLASTLTDAVVPVSGHGFWYLSRGENACGIGTYGTQSNGTPRTTTTCP